MSRLIDVDVDDEVLDVESVLLVDDDVEPTVVAVLDVVTAVVTVVVDAAVVATVVWGIAGDVVAERVSVVASSG